VLLAPHAWFMAGPRDGDRLARPAPAPPPAKRMRFAVLAAVAAAATLVLAGVAYAAASLHNRKLLAIATATATATATPMQSQGLGLWPATSAFARWSSTAATCLHAARAGPSANAAFWPRLRVFAYRTACTVTNVLDDRALRDPWHAFAAPPEFPPHPVHGARARLPAQHPVRCLANLHGVQRDGFGSQVSQWLRLVGVAAAYGLAPCLTATERMDHVTPLERAALLRATGLRFKPKRTCMRCAFHLGRHRVSDEQVAVADTSVDTFRAALEPPHVRAALAALYVPPAPLDPDRPPPMFAACYPHGTEPTCTPVAVHVRVVD